MKIQSLRLLLILTLVLLPASLFCGGAPQSTAEVTGFSWDRVPVYLHFGKRGPEMTSQELDFVAQHTLLVTLEKGHGAAVHGSTEEGIYATSRELKRRNPRLKVLFYFNAFVNWQPYDALKTFKPEWLLRDRAGELVTHPSGTPRPDLSIPAMREWWAETVAEAMRHAPLDGVFADAFPQVLTPSLSQRLGQAKAGAIASGLREMVALAKRKMGEGKIILANGTRGEDYREILDWEGIDGVMIEHFGSFSSAEPGDIKADLETMALAAAKKKFVVLKGWPGFSVFDKDVRSKPRSELLALARESMAFPLACFLVGAQPGHAFCYSWGYTHEQGMLEEYAEFGRSLGSPQAGATWQGLTATREFAHASVWVDLTTKQARVAWKEP